VVEQGTGEDRNERRARELAELLQELRVMLPGVQVFFAFLLTVPCSARFEVVMPLQEADFFGMRGRVVSQSRAWYCSWWRWSG
jgi:hypothetical protein